MSKFYKFNLKGELLSEKSFDEINETSNNFPEYSQARKAKKWGVVETYSSDTVIDFKYDRIDFVPSFDNSLIVIGWLNEKTYLTDINDNKLTPGSYDKLYFERNTDFAVSKQNDLSGIVSIKNKVIFETEYSDCKIILQNVFLLQKNEIFYLGNENGEIINKLECQAIFPKKFFLENAWCLNYFTFKSNDKYGLLDKNFNILIPAKFEYLNVNQFNKIYGQLDQIEYEIDIKGNLLKKIDFSLRFSTSFDIIHIGENKFNYIVSKDKSYGAKRGILDNDYNLILPIEYDWIEYTYGIWKVRKGRTEYILDDDYNLITDSKFKMIGKFEEERIACVQNMDSKYTFINKTASQINNNTFDSVFLGSRSSLDYLFENSKSSFKSGLCGVCINSKWGFIDLNCNLVIECIYDEITEFDSRNNAIVKFNGKMGVINNEGKVIIDFKYDNIISYDLQSNVLICKKDDLLGMIDLDNNELIQFSFTKLYFNKVGSISGFLKKPLTKKLPIQKTIEPIELLNKKLLEKHNTLIHKDIIRVMVMAIVSGQEDDLSNRLYIIDVIKKDNDSATFISGYAGGGVWDECTFINEKEYKGEKGGFTVFDYVRDDHVIKDLVSEYISEIDEDLDEYQYKSLKHFIEVGDEDLKLLYSVWYNDSVDYSEITKNDKKRFKKLLNSAGGVWWKDWNFKF